MKDAVFEGIYFVLHLMGLPWLIRTLFQRNAITILVYHDPSPEIFAKHLNYLKSRFTLVSMDDAIIAINSGNIHKLGRYPLVITIDDGRAGNYHLLPVIKAYKITPVIFLCSQVAGTQRAYWDDVVLARAPRELLRLKEMSEGERRQELADRFDFHYEDAFLNSRSGLSMEEIHELTPYVDFGSHGRFHQSIPFLAGEEMISEIKESKLEIEAMTGRPCHHFAFPSGYYDAKSKELVAQTGYRSSRTSNAGYNKRPADCFGLKVTGASDGASVAKLAFQLTGLPRTVRRFWK